MGYTTVRDGGGLDAGFKLAVEQGLIPGPRLVLAVQIISPTGGIGDRVSPSGHDCCAAYDPLLPESVANGPDAVRDVVRTMVRAGADVIKTATTGGASSRAGARAARRGLHPRRDGGAGGGVARARAARDVPRPRRTRAAHRARGRRRHDRARLLSRRGSRRCSSRWPCRAPSSCPRSRSTSTTARARRRTCGSAPSRSTRTTWPACAGRSSWACRSRRAPTRAATAIRRTRSSSSTWSRRACRRCRRCARPRSGRRGAWGSSARSARSRRGALADLVVVNGNPLDDISVLLDPARDRAGLQGRGDLRRPPGAMRRARLRIPRRDRRAGAGNVEV